MATPAPSSSQGALARRSFSGWATTLPSSTSAVVGTTEISPRRPQGASSTSLMVLTGLISALNTPASPLTGYRLINRSYPTSSAAATPSRQRAPSRLIRLPKKLASAMSCSTPRPNVKRCSAVLVTTQPTRYSSTVRFASLPTRGQPPRPTLRDAASEKGMAAPAQNRNHGNTRSVSVTPPPQGAC